MGRRCPRRSRRSASAGLGSCRPPPPAPLPPTCVPPAHTRSPPPRRSQEDDLIRASVLQLGPKWGLIANRLKGRTEHAVRNRWHRLQSQLRQIAAEQAAVHAAAGAHTAAGAHATVAHSQAPPIFPPGTTVYRVSNGAPQLMLPPPGMPGGPPPGAVAGTRPPPAGAAAAAPGTVYISGASCAAPLYTGGLPTPTAHAYAPPPGHAGPPPPFAPPPNSGAMYMQPVYQYQMPAHVAAPQHLQPPPHFQHLPPHEFPPHQQQPPPPAWAGPSPPQHYAAPPHPGSAQRVAAPPGSEPWATSEAFAAAAVEHAGVGVSTGYSVVDAPSAAPSAAGGGAAPTGFAPFPAYEVQPPPAAVGGTVVDADATAAPSAAAPPPTAPWAPMPPPIGGGEQPS